MFDNNDDDEDALVSALDLLDQVRKPKRQRPTAAEIRGRLGDDRVKLDVTEEEQQSFFRSASTVWTRKTKHDGRLHLTVGTLRMGQNGSSGKPPNLP